MSSRSSGDSDASGGRFDRKKKVKDKRKGGTMDKDKVGNGLFHCQAWRNSNAKRELFNDYATDIIWHVFI